MAPNVHRIRRQRWVVRAGSPADAFAIRQYLREHSLELLEPALQSAFDDAADAGTVLHLPKLELHVRVASLDALATTLPDRVAEQLRELLPPHRAGATMPDAPPTVRVSTAPEDRWEQLLHYLNTGMLRWESASVPPPEAARQLRETFHEQPARLHSWLAANRVPLDFHRRLIEILGIDEMAGFAATAASHPGSDESSKIAALIRHLLEDRATGPARHIRRQLAALVLQAGHRPEGTAPRPIVDLLAGVLEPRELAEFVAASPPIVRSWLERRAGGPANDAGGAGAAAAAGPDSVSMQAPASPRPGTPPGSADGQPADREPSQPPGSADAPRESEAALMRTHAAFRAEPPPGSPDLDRPKRGDDADGAQRESGIPAGAARLSDVDTQGTVAPGSPAPVRERPAAILAPRATGGTHPDLVPQAGLILLHPFLPRLFEHLHVKDPGQRELRAGSLERAGAILHWLATAREEVFEFELGFIKILLGLTPATPLHVAAELATAEDRAETEALLRAVIEHWTVLGSTSPNGLRAAFLEREGLLTDAGDDWRLRVERRGIDVLVDRLPWSLNVVKLPWAAKPIFATW